MAGWVKISQPSPDSNERRWMNAFAILEGNHLAFHETDISCSDGPFLGVDLSVDSWRVYNQTGEIRGLDVTNPDCLIEIKIKE